MKLRLMPNKFTRARSKITFFLLAALTCAIAFTTELIPGAFAQSHPSGTSVVRGTNGSMTPQGTAALHMRMSPERPATADTARADQLAQQVRQSIKKYHNVRDAQEAGYLQFPPDAEGLSIIHYVNPRLSFQESWRLDPKQPGSLLYEKQSDGSLRLLGAMFTAPAEASLDELNERVPLSSTRWHLHVNVCVPDPIWDEEQWAREQNNLPLFGPDSPIATEEKCDAIGGEFLPTVFGWMVHANVFAEDPADVWNPMYGGDREDMSG